MPSPEFESVVDRQLAMPEDDMAFGKDEEEEEEEEDASGRVGHKKGPARRLSRAEKQTRARIRKL
jgi:hypothetical protein